MADICQKVLDGLEMIAKWALSIVHDMPIQLIKIVIFKDLLKCASPMILWSMCRFA